MNVEFASDFAKFWTRLSAGKIPSSLRTWGPYPDEEAMLGRARHFILDNKPDDWRSIVAGKAEAVSQFDVEGMDRVVAICACGRSGSVLLASYFDGHDDVVLMPNLLSQKIYPFFERYGSLSLRDKLIAYPFFKTDEVDNFLDFFGGDFPINPVDYYAAVDALLEAYAHVATHVLESRRYFFIFLHIAYCVALGRRTATSNPLIVYAQHMLDEQLAERFIADFPNGRLIQTVRDPITNSRRLFEHSLPRRGVLAAWSVMSYLTFAGAPHPGMESRTRIVRFEDLHVRLYETMRALADWLGVSYGEVLLSSTFHGRPYVWRSGTNIWSGRRPEAAIRDCSNTTLSDRWLLFVLLHEDLTAWKYPCPRICGHPLARVLLCGLIIWIPTKMERNSFKTVARDGFRAILRSARSMIICRIGIMVLVTTEIFRRVAFKKNVASAL